VSAHTLASTRNRQWGGRIKPATPCSQMVAATFGRWLGGTLGHTSVAALLGGVVGRLGYRHISRRKLDPVRPPDYFPHFPGLRVENSSALRRRVPRA
jgi:hypothetical protein